MAEQNQGQTAHRPPRRRWWRWVVLGLLVVGAAIWFTRPLWYGVAVTVIAPTRGVVVETVVSSGRVLAPSQVEVASTVSGTVKVVASNAGDVVAQGQLLITLDDAEALAAVARAEATLEGLAAKRLDLAKRRGPSTDEALKQARTSLLQAEADYTRDASLAKDGALARNDLQRTQTALALARSKLRAAGIEARATGIDGAESAAIDAQEADAKAALEAARVRLASYLRYSPVDGVVIKRVVEPGQVVQPGVPLLLIAESGRSRLVIEPDEKNLRVLALGQPALASADAFPERRFPVVVSWIASSVDARRGTVEVHLALAEPQPFLKSDMTVSVEIEVARKADALTLPSEVVRDLATDEPWVMVVDGKHAQRLPVKLGMKGDTVVEVLSGLEPDAVVITPVPTLPSVGARVRLPDKAGD
jgi:HlyD family secretion protein